MTADASRADAPPRQRVRARQRRPRVPPSQLPPVLRRPARLRSSAPGCRRSRRRGSSSSSPDDPLILGLVDRAAVPPGPDPRAVRRAHRRRPAQAADADRDPGDPDDALLHPVRRWSFTDTVQVWHVIVLATILGASPTSSTCRPARRSRSRWSAARTSATPSPSTRAMFNGARIVGPAIAGLTIGLFGVVEPRSSSTRVSFFAVILACLAMRQERAPPRRRRSSRPRSTREVVCDARRGPALRPARRHWSCSRSVIVGLVSTFGMNFGVIIPPLTRAGPPLRRDRVRLPHGRDRASGRSSPRSASRSRAARAPPSSRSARSCSASRSIATSARPACSPVAMVTDDRSSGSARSRWPRPRTPRSSSPSRTSSAAG